MKPVILSFFFFTISLAAFAQKNEKHYIVLETSQNYTHLNSSDSSWKASVPYKHRVRLVTELFDFPKGIDSRLSVEAGVQFLEYMYTEYKPELDKMKMHLSYYAGSDWIYDPENKASVDQYNNLFKEPENGEYKYEVILIKGFKFIPLKYPVVKNSGTTPLHKKALLLLSKGEE